MPSVDQPIVYSDAHNAEATPSPGSLVGIKLDLDQGIHLEHEQQLHLPPSYDAVANADHHQQQNSSSYNPYGTNDYSGYDFSLDS